MQKILRCCLLTLFPFSAFATPQFSPRQDITTSLHNLGHVAIADFNGDGKLDLAVTSSLDPTLLVYLNHGDGTFAAPLSAQLSTQQSLAAVVAGDFNEDGKQDLIVATLSGNQHAVFLSGNGDGTFTEGAVLPSSVSFLNAATVDLNHDGHLDLVTANNGNVMVYLGDGHGNFALQPFSNSGPSSPFTGLTVGDFNKDHQLDIVIGEYNGGNNFYPQRGIRLYTGNGNGTFNPPSFFTADYIISPYLLASADFNGDGNLDILFSEPNITVILFGNGDGTFKLADSQTSGFYIKDPPTTAAAPPLVAAADMDGDGRPDGIVADILANSINVFVNDGTGTFPGGADFSASLDAGTSAMQVADLNGDGLPDIILTNYITQKISIYLSVRLQVAPTVTLSTSAAQALIGTPLTLTAQVGGSLPAHTASGSATLLDGTTTLAQQTLDTTGKAAFSLSNLAVGQHSLSVTYSGDPVYKAAVSTPVTQFITDFQPSLPTSAQTVSAGSTATYAVTITPVTGLVGTATLSCSGLPSGYNCAPVTVSLSGQPINSSVTVVTPSKTQAKAGLPLRKSIYTAFLGLLIVPLLLRRRYQSLPSLAAVILATTCMITIAGCSGGSNSGESTPPPVTTSFTITVSVTQAGQTVMHSVPATLTVK